MSCPYLHRETAALRRVGMDLSEPCPLLVTHAWSCRHPFHGFVLELGDAQADVERHCASCSLPHEEVDVAAAAAAQPRPPRDEDRAS